MTPSDERNLLCLQTILHDVGCTASLPKYNGSDVLYAFRGHCCLLPCSVARAFPYCKMKSLAEVWIDLNFGLCKDLLREPIASACSRKSTPSMNSSQADTLTAWTPLCKLGYRCVPTHTLAKLRQLGSQITLETFK